MAHECPDCGSICRCNGDTDDLLLNDDEAFNHCIHCLDDVEDIENYDVEDEESA